MAAAENRNSESFDTLETNPVVVVQGLGTLLRNFLREIGGIFWFITSTLAETIGAAAVRFAPQVSFATPNAPVSARFRWLQWFRFSWD